MCQEGAVQRPGPGRLAPFLFLLLAALWLLLQVKSFKITK
jgi:hypothetical protein